jgi:DNA-binding transcriptional ArsR family regulator
MPSRTADPFGAIADPTRRSILDLLRERETATAGQIAAHFPQASRPAISKHLKVLRRARLVQAEERGREWHYRLDPAPLGEIYHQWLASFAPYWQQSLERLKQQVEANE